MGVGLPVCLNPAYPHVMALWGSEGAECDCEGNCYTPRDSRNVNTHLMCQGAVKIYAQNCLQAPAE